MPVCYRLDSVSSVAENDAVVVDVTTYSRPAWATNIEALLSQVAPEVERLRPSGDLPLLFSPDRSATYRLPQASWGAVDRLLTAHSRPVVTAMTDCDASVCLDFYAHPDGDGQGESVWPKTEIGKLVHQAKYGGQVGSLVPSLSRKIATFMRGHPIYAAATVVAAMPSSSAIGRAPRTTLAGRVTMELSQKFSLPEIGLRRVKLPQHQQKALPDGEDADGNQWETMAACESDVRGQAVVIIDDLMRHGSTLKEATRALRQAGAAAVISIGLVKNYKGTKGYEFDGR